MRRSSSAPAILFYEKEDEDQEEVTQENRFEVTDLATQPRQPIGFSQDFLHKNGFDVIEYLNQGKFGTVYSAIGNELASAFCLIDQKPEGGVIGENVWMSGHQFYVKKSLTGIKVAIKYLPPPQPPQWESPQEEEDNTLETVITGLNDLLLSDTDESIGQTLEEVQKLMKLKHKNLIEIYNVLEEKERGVYIIMEFLEMTLKEWVKGMNENNVSLDDYSIDIFLEQMIDGLSYLHSNHILHNDLHSDNVMVCEDTDGSLLMKIVDFGLSEYFSESNSPDADIRGLGQLLKLVMSLLESENPEYKQALEDFSYTCVKRIFSNISEVQKEFESMKKLLKK